MWSMWPWDITTASISLMEKPVMFRYGYALVGSPVAVFTPTSISTLEFGDCTSRHDLPTSRNPPSDTTLIQSDAATGWHIFLPMLTRNFFLSAASATAIL